MEALKILRLGVKEHLIALNREFKNKAHWAHWEIMDYKIEDEKLKLLVSIIKDDKKTNKIYFIWPCNQFSYYLKNEELTRPQLVVLENLFLEIAIDMYGSQALGTSLVREDWSEKTFNHLNVVSVT